MSVAGAFLFAGVHFFLVRFGFCEIALITDHLQDSIVVLLAMDAGDRKRLALAVLDRVAVVALGAVDPVVNNACGLFLSFSSFNLLKLLRSGNFILFRFSNFNLFRFSKTTRDFG